MVIVKRVGRFASLVLTAALLVLGAVTTQVFSGCSNHETPQSNQNAPSGGGLFTLTDVDTGIYRIEVYYFTDDIEDAASWAEATDQENMVLSSVVSVKQDETAGSVTLKVGATVFDETDTFLVVVTGVVVTGGVLTEDEGVTKYSIVYFEDGKASIDWEEDMEPPPESDDTGTKEINTVAKAAEYLDAQTGGATANAPISLVLSLDLAAVNSNNYNG